MRPDRCPTCGIHRQIVPSNRIHFWRFFAATSMARVLLLLVVLDAVLLANCLPDHLQKSGVPFLARTTFREGAFKRIISRNVDQFVQQDGNGRAISKLRKDRVGGEFQRVVQQDGSGTVISKLPKDRAGGEFQGVPDMAMAGQQDLREEITRATFGEADLKRIISRHGAQFVQQDGNGRAISKLPKDRAGAETQGVSGVAMAGEKEGLQLQELRREAVVAKPWPEEFTVNFTTKSGAATGFIAYDWAQKRQIIYHGPKSTFCINFGTENACQMLEIPGGTYVYIPSLEQCFLSVEGVGSLPPEWTTYSEYVGTEDVPGVGQCRAFAFPPTAHVYYETVVGSLPCVFVFPEPTMTYYFLPETFEVSTPDEKYFDFPDYCFTDGIGAISKCVAA